MKIRFASVNEQKIRDAEEFLGKSGIEIVKFPVRIVETQTEDLNKLVSDKLLDAFKLIGKPVFVEHSGLFINSLNGFPGGLTQTFWDRLHAIRFSDLIGSLDDPSAVARTLIGYCDRRKRHFFKGEVTGSDLPYSCWRPGFRMGQHIRARRLFVHLRGTGRCA